MIKPFDPVIRCRRCGGTRKEHKGPAPYRCPTRLAETYWTPWTAEAYAAAEREGVKGKPIARAGSEKLKELKERSEKLKKRKDPMGEKTVNQAARALAATRWKQKTPEERSAYASRIASKPRAVQRCFCGQHSMLRAAARRFDCCRKAGVITLNARPLIEVAE